ncbi:carbonyl reductase [Pediococcus damnosus]|uniref:SDR family NAD(P)-dependent oxidoreductase n=1 Tax=Pediococcus damnosus TaxID=51663 RepID=UPI000C1CA776|nr:SDR family NAD(P)-dependent oxidoreductase [Pediococcus damnosus]PIO80559.1 carbonyl reductase [Pediococcus damnosus]
MSSQTQIITLITGAERGLGFEYAKQLGKRGQHIFIGAYDMKLGKKAIADLKDQGVDADLVNCDVTSQESIDLAIKTIDQKYGYLNILINNAGLGGPQSKPSETTSAALHKVFDTNFFGTVAMTNATLPLLKKAPFGKIINVASDMGSLTLASDPSSMLYKFDAFAYPASKTAVNSMTIAYSKELKDTNVTINSINPGMTATDLINKKAFQANGAQGVEQGAKRAVELASDPKNDLNGTFTEEDGKLPW